MRFYKVVVLFLAASLMFTGCKKNMKKGDEASVGYKDVALTEYSLEDFAQPGAELKEVFKNIHFEYNKYNIKDSDAPILEGIANWMKSNNAKHVLIEGHCDERGSAQFNLALGEQRALSARRYLINLGIDAAKIHTVSYGKERPADAGHTEESWSVNRRCEFLINK
jgi:peptidoglycan-associated lipoprotein